MPQQTRVEYAGAIYHVMSRVSGEHHAGALHRKTSRVRAERIIAEELTRVGWTEADLEKERKSAPAKLAIAACLRKETTLTVKEIATRLRLGTPKGANATLHRYMQSSRTAQGAETGQ